ncbi:MAG: zinc transporter ZntB [Gammaproteobacteria bacterium]|nr:zinc transporter ZntB [Gammaproteobacteria bacterium]
MNDYLHNCYFSETVYGEIESLTAPCPEPAATHWTHLDLNNDHSMEWLRNRSGIDPVVIDGLSAAETRPRAWANEQGILIILRGVNMNPGQNAEDMVSVRIWIEANRIISVRRHRLLSVQDLHEAIATRRVKPDTGRFLTELVERMADRIGDFVNSIEEDMGNAEDGLETSDPTEFRTRLGDLRRQIAGVRRFLAPQRDALDRLNHINTSVLGSETRQRLREESDRVSRYLEDLDLARERAVVLQEAFVSQLVQQQNTRMYVLSVVAAIFLPLTFLTGMLGMNVGGLPGVDSPWGFALASLVMVVCCVLMVLYFKKKDWF